jgi:hypothetical protein
MPPPKKPPSRFASIPPGASFEDDVQLDELRQPWSLTFGEFLRIVRERYGFTEHQEGGERYLVSSDGQVRPIPEIGLHDQLDARDTGFLCSTFGIPPEDFGLPAEAAEGG